MDVALNSTLKGICTFWERAVEQCRESRKPFMSIAKQCWHFYAGSTRFMWEDKFRHEYIGEGFDKGKFQVTLNKAFEFVTLYGPNLFWQYPQRRITPLRPIEFGPEVLGDPQDPNIQQFFAQVQAENSQEWAVRTLTSEMMERWLNYTPTEQTGTLAYQGQMAVIEALIKGRSVLWPEAYSFPGSDRTLTQLTWDTVDHLFIDADCRCPLLSTAKYIIRRHVNTIWDVEKRFDLPEGYLKGKGNWESSWSSLDNDPDSKKARDRGEATDLIVWYEVFSKAGVGTRMQSSKSKKREAKSEDINAPYHKAFEDVLGDYAYVCFTPGVEHPLNCTPQQLEEATDDDVREMFAWPFPSYIDGKWPCAILDFHPTPNSAWPLAPLAPALGPLICINVIVSAIVEQAWENRKTIIGYLKSAASMLEEALKSDRSTVFVEIADSTNKTVKDCVDILQRPGMNKDLLEALAVMTDIFEKNSNLTALAYGITDTQSRSAADSNAKKERISVRPAKMAADVKAWMVVAANLEKLLASWTVTGSDVEPLLGRVGARLWDMHISSADPELIARCMSATVEADDMARPDRERDFQNLSNLSGWLLPTLESYAAVSGNTDPLNTFLTMLGKAMGEDVTDLLMGPWVPAPPSEEEMAMQQHLQQLEVAGKEADVAKGQADAGRAAAEMMQASQDPGQDADHEMKLIQSGEMFAQKMAQNEIQNRLKLLQQRQMFQEKQRQAAITTGIISRSRMQQQSASNQRKTSGVGK